jgi:hypothetical protein
MKLKITDLRMFFMDGVSQYYRVGKEDVEDIKQVREEFIIKHKKSSIGVKGIAYKYYYVLEN